MRDLTEDQVLQHLRQNTVGRNNQLSVLVKLLNSAKESTALAIDGPWGSGKTVFIKQLLVLADARVEDYGRNDLDDIAIGSLREKQKVFYFNAWENDYIGDALGAILLQLIADHDESLNLAAIKRAATMINLSAGIKNVSHDFIDFNANTRKDKLVSDIKERVDRHEAVKEFIDNLKGEAERLVFVVDELDRCRPSFAIEILEVIKHYFTRDDVTFIVTTNVKELSHTVEKHYGYGFDGYAYLDKFFDFTIGLRKVETERYARDVLNWRPNGAIVHELAHDAIDYYELSMRQTNSYYSALRLIDNFLTRNNNWSDDQYPIQLIFVPLALGLKLISRAQYAEFVNGKGEKILRDFMPHTMSGLHYAQRLIQDRTGLDEQQFREKAIDALVVEYQNLFTPEGRRRGSENLQDFRDAVSLISSYTTIPEEARTEE